MKIKNRKKYTPYFFILPVVIFMVIIFFYPLYLTFKYSLFETTILNINNKFIGFNNFLSLLKNADFISTIKKTFQWTFVALSIKIFLGLFLAIILSKKIKGIKIYRTLILIPWAIPTTVSAIIWSWIYDGNYGYLNYFLLKFHIISQSISWLGEKKSAFLCTAFADAWSGIPFVALSLLSGIQAIPESLYEAAKVDGATKLQIFLKITLPQLKNLLLVVITLTFIWTFNSFNTIWLLTKGGPVDSTKTLMIDIYREAFGSFNVSISSSMSVIVFLILISVSFIYWKITTNNKGVAND